MEAISSLLSFFQIKRKIEMGVHGTPETRSGCPRSVVHQKIRPR